MDVNEIKAARYRYLKALYDASGGSRRQHFDRLKLGDALGFDAELTNNIALYLSDEGLLRFETKVNISITHSGIKQVEDAMSHPDRPTQYFPAVNIISVGTMVNSNIQQASPGASLSVHVEECHIIELTTILNEVKSSLDNLNLSDKDRKSAEAQLQSAEAELHSPHPKSGIIRESLKSIRTILESAAGSVLASNLAQKLGTLLASIG